MSDFKITGNPNPEVGKEEFYSVNTLLPKIEPYYPNHIPSPTYNNFEYPVTWEVYLLERGEWRKAKGNEKTGNIVSFTFLQRSLDRKGIRILAKRGEQIARLDIKSHPAEIPKIQSVELLDKNGKKPTQPLAYGQTLKARVHCLHMDRRTVHATLWEDDADGGGHDKQNEKNKAKTLPGIVRNGIADIDFILTPDFKKIANARNANEGKTHEYYVTAEIFQQEKVSSNNLNVNNSDYESESKKQPVKKTPPAETKGESKKDQKGIQPPAAGKKYDWVEEAFKIKPIFLPDPMDFTNSVMKVFVPDEEEKENLGCGEKYCIKKGDKSELIREVNIRLAGFGGNVPTDEFTDRTEKMIKQFQRDYMEAPETGKICGNVLKAIDNFSNKWYEKIINYKCLCHASDSKVEIKNRCLGYGKEKKDEHPGMHRTLLWGISALKFYISKQTKYQYNSTSAGYRCWAHNDSVPRTSTNHMGKAVDIQFSNDKDKISGKSNDNITPLKEIRDKFYIKFLKAEEGWSIPSVNNNYRLEPIGMGKDQSYSWIHMDVSLFKTEYLKDSYFIKQQNLIIGKSILVLAEELGFKNTCSCKSVFAKKNDTTSNTNCETCKSLDKPRMDFYKQFGDSSIKLVESKGKSNKFKGLYMVAQRRQENSFALNVPNNNPMNIKGVGDLGSKDIDTHEYIKGKKVFMKDKFADFSTVEKGFEGYLKTLDNNFNHAYIAILDDSKTIDDFLTGMQDKGKLGPYATDPEYKKLIKILFNGVVNDYKKWLNCKLTCTSHKTEVEKIKTDIKLLEKLK